MRDTATRLDVTYAALTEAMDQNTALAAMLAGAEKGEKLA
jgi:hypothetical protein